MKVTFQTDKLRQLCEEQRVATKKLGQPCAKKLAARLFNLMVADSVQDLVVGDPHPLTGTSWTVFIKSTRRNEAGI